ncbi:hypothetical protein CAI21_18515 [Alkalilimnicola ehrlichii]|uniref:hypothetical protein n=1 Tax=Alkalilimnicola ehrlichii TaxID=351052 RepID=UPI000E2F8D09|nr:hypothetical protein [Alkalilimnicola ehrlichii]RFA25759.1 hypothetical protein CAI21_18515 [Alkalilimnicola ehrlichii]
MVQMISERRAGMTAAAPTEDPRRLRWGAIFGGAFVALGVWALLYVFGLAVGLVSVDVTAGGLSFPGLFAGIWAVIAPIVALFVGGYVAARSAGAQDRMSGAIHGAVLWGFATVLGMVAVWMLVSALIAGAVGLGQGLVGVAQQANGQALDVGAQQLLDPINQQLEEAGHPTLTAGELESAMQDVVTQGLQGGEVNQQVIEQSLVANTGLDQQSVQEISGTLQQEIQGVLGDAEQAAADAAEATGAAMWGCSSPCCLV